MGTTSEKRRRVVVTGLGLATALGLEVSTNWQKALKGITGIRTLVYPGAESSPVQATGSISDEQWRQIAAAFPMEAQQQGEKRTLFALWAAQRAMSDAGLDPLPATGRERYGVMVAAGAPINRLEDIAPWTDTSGGFDLVRFGQQYQQVHPESIMRNNSHRPATLIASKFGLGGYNGTITSACASATQALGLALRSIQRGESDLMLAGGADSMINPVGLIFFVLLGAANTTRDAPEKACRPFDRRRAGLVMGEGAGLVVLEAEAHARQRGAKIYGEVVGYGSSMDAYQVTAPEPKGYGASRSMEQALMDSGLANTDIDYINAHGTGTKLNDLAETLAIKRTFGEHADRLLVNSSKPLIGHLLAASGGPEFVFTVLSLHEDRVHPTLNLTTADPKCNLDYVVGEARQAQIRAALSNSFGFGGQNASIVIKKYRG
ncbi:MAG: beta-ketoacyl-[acyl-carrier-protein] synthase family protein [Gammaproteobacteria bacterium]|nr:beta-ketoacyl-[acyl-carrier-protein] synthase family protein [Gammaproteobacteria bacterium]